MVKIASVQMNSEKGKMAETAVAMKKYVCEAADKGAQLVILPEGIYQGYVFDSYEECFSMAEEVPSGKICTEMTELAKEKGVYIIWGMYEREGPDLYNSAVFVGPEGFVGKYRKMHYWATEKLYCEPSDSGFPVFHTKLGKIGIIICYDLWFPESSRILTVEGADLIVTPTGWVEDEGAEDNYPIKDYPPANILCIGTAHTNGVYVAASARVGYEGSTKWVGHSIICDPKGNILARAGNKEEEIIYADVDLWKAKSTRSWGERTNIIKDRRTDYYSETLGYDGKGYIL
ncbi:MAG: hydratase [Lachnospiraceae bacterium]|nr:hydratase [Lachnospiraceae bacterium]